MSPALNSAKERPILFSPPMVRAIIEGKKSQTRRLLRVPDHPAVADWVLDSEYRAAARAHSEKVAEQYVSTFPYGRVPCIYGKPGDHLWVRERHAYLDVQKSALSQFPLGPQNNNEVGPDIWLVAVEYSDGTQHDDLSVEGEKPKQTRERGELGWRPGMFMHRWASRITLEVTGVRLERLQAISEADAMAEGIARCDNGTFDGGGAAMGPNAQHAYMRLWDSLNAKRAPWESNPWVWVVEFRNYSPISKSNAVSGRLWLTRRSKASSGLFDRRLE